MESAGGEGEEREDRPFKRPVQISGQKFPVAQDFRPRNLIFFSFYQVSASTRDVSCALFFPWTQLWLRTGRNDPQLEKHVAGIAATPASLSEKMLRNPSKIFKLLQETCTFSRFDLRSTSNSLKEDRKQNYNKKYYVWTSVPHLR